MFHRQRECPQRGLLQEVEDVQEFARGPLGSIPGAAQEKTGERQMWHEETIRAQCWGDKQRLLSEACPCGEELGPFRSRVGLVYAEAGEKAPGLVSALSAGWKRD